MTAMFASGRRRCRFGLYFFLLDDHAHDRYLCPRFQLFMLFFVFWTIEVNSAANGGPKVDTAQASHNLFIQLTEVSDGFRGCCQCII